MSTNSNTPNNSEEVDLGQLFKLIGNGFDRFFNFIANIFKNIFLAIIWVILIIKKRIIYLVLAAIIGFLTGFLINKSTPLKYKSSVTVVLNYPAGEYLYKTISYFNDLVKQQNYKTLGTLLDLDVERTKSILSFDVEPAVSENDKLLAFNEYIKPLDSLARSELKYNDFLEQSDNFIYNHQQISLISTDRNNFKSVFKSIVNDINTNNFYLNEQRKDIEELNQTKKYLELSLSKSESLQNTYKKVLEKGLGADNAPKASEIGITFEASGKTDKTREFDLYQSDLKLSRELVGTERGLLEREFIIEMIENQQDSGFINDKKTFLGLELNPTFFYVLRTVLLALIILFGIEFLKFIEKFNKKVNN